jgi:hypothetical protein
MIWPVARRGRPRQRHVPDILSIPAEDMLANAKWRTISWRTGTAASRLPIAQTNSSTTREIGRMPKAKRTYRGQRATDANDRITM